MTRYKRRPDVPFEETSRANSIRRILKALRKCSSDHVEVVAKQLEDHVKKYHDPQPA